MRRIYPRFLSLGFYQLLSLAFVFRLICIHRYFTGDTWLGEGRGVLPFGIIYIYYLIFWGFSADCVEVVSFNRAHKSTKAEPTDNNLSLGVFIISWRAREQNLRSACRYICGSSGNWFAHRINFGYGQARSCGLIVFMHVVGDIPQGLRLGGGWPFKIIDAHFQAALGKHRHCRHFKLLPLATARDSCPISGLPFTDPRHLISAKTQKRKNAGALVDPCRSVSSCFVAFLSVSFRSIRLRMRAYASSLVVRGAQQTESHWRSAPKTNSKMRRTPLLALSFFSLWRCKLSALLKYR